MFPKWLKIAVLCTLWYATSSAQNVVGKKLLSQYPHPMSLTLIQLLSITLYSLPLLIYTGKETFIRNSLKKQINSKYYFKYVIPLAIGKFLASVSSHVSIANVPVSYSHTVKATMPLFTVAITKVLFNDRQSTQTYLSLIPIITGVILASATELNFNTLGLISALISTLFFALQNIFSKEVLKNTKLHQFELLYVLARMSLVFYLPIYIIFDRSIFLAEFSDWILLILDGVLSFLQNVLAFSFIKFVTPLTYSVANCSKRIFVIAISLFVFRNDVGFVNVFGMVLAVVGVFLYNRAKFIEKDLKLLPVVNNNFLYV